MTLASARQATPLTLRALLWLGWLACALYLTANHVMWRDEVRALNLAERGGSLAEMVSAVRGYGHPMLWHVLLRAALAVYPHPVVLAVVAFAVAAATTALLAFKAPFRPLLLALALFGAFFVYEYVAFARNYCISALILFAIAWAYGRYRDVPGVLGVLLFALCNTNIHSVVLAGAFLVFWVLDLVAARPVSARAWRSLLAGAALLLAGVACCAWQVYPPVDDAVMPPAADLSRLPLLVATGLGPSFYELVPANLQSGLSVLILLPVLLLASLLALRRSSAAVIAAALALVGLEVVFLVINLGSYRHQALFLAFLLAMLWIVEERTPSQETADRSWLPRAGLVALLALQVWSSVFIALRVAGGVPESRSRDLARLIATPALHDAVLLGDPDTMLEAVGYYARNPVYLVREGRFAKSPTFTRAAAREPMTLERILSSARAIHARTKRPVVIVMGERIDAGTPPGTRSRGYYGKLVIGPDDVRTFLAATRRIARFAPAATDESYDVFVLRDAALTRS